MSNTVEPVPVMIVREARAGLLTREDTAGALVDYLIAVHARTGRVITMRDLKLCDRIAVLAVPSN